MGSRFNEIESIRHFLASEGNLSGCIVQGLDLANEAIDWASMAVKDCIFLGCTFPATVDLTGLGARGARIFPSFDGLPYHPYRASLYTWRELMEGYAQDDDQSTDRKIHDHIVATGHQHPDLLEALAQRIHDHAVDNALRDLIGEPKERRIVAIMGGHSTKRTDPNFRKVATVAWRLAREGYFVATGGGPGAMEAGNLGAYFAGTDEKVLSEAIALLEGAPHHTSEGYVSAARAVIDRWPDGAESLAVPTWFYGHEPSNLFASHIAKYFSNSIREDTLLAIAIHGIVFSPGSAGTTQEIFQDAAQNHYATYDWTSPMVFLGTERYGPSTGIYALLKRLAEDKAYKASMHLSDDPADIVDFIKSHPPVKA